MEEFEKREGGKYTVLCIRARCLSTSRGPKNTLEKKKKGKTSEDKQGVIVEEESNQCFPLTWEISVIILFLYSLPLPRDSISAGPLNSRRALRFHR